jgi:hypothetical protein
MAALSIDLILLDDTTSKVFSFLHPSDLLMVELVSKHWKSVLATDADIYQYHSRAIWSKLIYNVPAEVDLFERVKQLSTKELKKLLVAVDISGCIEKSDYQRLALIHLLYLPCYRPDSGIDYQICHKSVSSDKYCYAPWATKISNAKASYYYAKREAKRDRIWMSELNAIEWEFKFNDDMNFAVEEDSWTSRFHSDYTLTSTLHDHAMNWKVSVP